MQHCKKTNVFYTEDMSKTDSLYKNIHQDIIDRCRHGEQKAQFQLYKLYYKAMYNTCYRIVSDEMEAEDIMQEAFLKAFDKLDTYSGKVSFGAWLKRIVINHSLDQIKKKKLDFKEFDKHAHEVKEEEEVNEDDITEQIEEIKDSINQLPDGYRIVLSLYLLEGYDHDEIGEILNISGSTSRSQYTRAKNKLKEQLANKRINR
jgi:RNA polymerase sigma-70 factor (ECF subfamily)